MQRNISSCNEKWCQFVKTVTSLRENPDIVTGPVWHLATIFSTLRAPTPGGDSDERPGRCGTGGSIQSHITDHRLYSNFCDIDKTWCIKRFYYDLDDILSSFVLCFCCILTILWRRALKTRSCGNSCFVWIKTTIHWIKEAKYCNNIYLTFNI